MSDLRTVLTIDNIKCITNNLYCDNEETNNKKNRSSCLKLDPDEVLDWIKKIGIDLAPYQEDMINDMCTGIPFKSARGIGRSFCANLLGLYIANLFDSNDYNEKVTNLYPIWFAVKEKIVPQNYINFLRRRMSEENFVNEYSFGFEQGEEHYAN